MKMKMLILILIIVLVVLAITGSCTTSARVQKIKENVGQEAFIESVRNGVYSKVEMFEYKGADIRIESIEGETTQYFARGQEDSRSVQLIGVEGVQQQDPNIFIENLYQEINKNISYLSGPHPKSLPEGRSVFLGEYTCAQGLAGSIVIVFRYGGDLIFSNLHGPPVLKNNPQPVGYFLTVGTYNPDSNRFTEVPDKWLVLQAPGWIMSGRDGVYSHEAGILEGAVQIGQTWPNGELLCTNFRHSRIASNKGTAVLKDEVLKPPITLVGTPMALPMGETRWIGNFFCSGTRFDLTLVIQHDEGGRLKGTFDFREAGIKGSSDSFLMAGTHNPDTGRFSMGPRGWISETSSVRGKQMYYVDGHHLELPPRLQIRIITDNGPCAEDKSISLSPLN